MKRSFRIVNYAVNGLGTGHVTRLIAINRWLRRHAAGLNISLEIYFLTSTEASALLFAERFPSFKLPSRTLIEEAGIDENGFIELARRWVQQTLTTLQPDVLVVDTFPQGYFNELDNYLDQCAHSIFINRPLKHTHIGLPGFRNAVLNYHLIQVPEYEQSVASLLPEEVHDRVRYIGPIIVRERDEVLSRGEARNALAISDDSLVVYITMGGGGDAKAEQQLQACCEALDLMPGIRLVVGAGPLYRGRCIYGERIIWLGQGSAAELMAGFDVAISAAGYNSFNELMHFGVPTIFLPQEKWADDQRARAERGVAAGAAVLLDSPFNATDLRRLIDEFRSPVRRESFSLAARNLVPLNHARDSAAAILHLLRPGAILVTRS